jgi:hypothetical protein
MDEPGGVWTSESPGAVIRGVGALAVFSTALALAGVQCSMPGEWPHTRDAVWLWQALERAGFREPDCTGSALVVDYGGTGLFGHDLYIWASKAPHLVPEFRRFRTIAGVRVYGYYEHRAVWRAGKRNVWVEGGPTTYRLPHARILAPIIRATVGRA